MIERNSGSVITISSEAGYAPKAYIYLSLSHYTVTLIFNSTQDFMIHYSTTKTAQLGM